MSFRAEALSQLRPNAKWTMRGDDVTWEDENQTQPTEQELVAKTEELKTAYPMRLLREERNRRLQETDWMSFSDLPTMADAWKTYRQALRDLPSTTEPQLDENGQLTNVTWPIKPT